MPSRKPRFPGRLTGLLLGFLWLSSAAVSAQSLIRDAEIEHTLKRIAAPLFRSAGVGANDIDILVVNDRTLNAFVLNGRAIFLHSGLVTRLKTVEMLQSVIAHELAHITSGHLVQRALNLGNARSAIGIGLLLSLAASVGGNSDAAAGIAIGTSGAAINNFLAHTRAEEAVADQIGVRYMVRAKIDPKAATDVLEIFRGQEALSASRQDAYARSHPLSQDRIRALKGQIAAHGGAKTVDQTDLVYWHKRMQAKFTAFLGNPSYILRHLDNNDTSEAATLTRAIAYHRQGDLKSSMQYMNNLLAARPDDAYYHELKGQILLEGRNAPAAVASYRKAGALAPHEPLILAGLGRALLSLKTKIGDQQALKVLRRARDMDARDARMLRDLAVAWAKSGNNGMASLVTAERYALLGQFKDAYANAIRAEGLLPRGSAGWLQAEDIAGATKSFAK